MAKLPELAAITQEAPDIVALTEEDEFYGEDVHLDEGQYTRDAAVIAIVRMLDQYKAHMSPEELSQLVSTVLTASPVECSIDSEIVYKYLVDGVNLQLPEVLGAQNANLVNVAVMLAYALAEEEIIEEEVLEKSMVVCINNIVNSLDPSVREQTLSSRFTEKQRVTLKRKSQELSL